MREQTQTRDSDRHRRRLAGGVLSIAGHLLVLFALFAVRPTLPKIADPPPIMVTLVDGPRLGMGGGSPGAAASPAPAEAEPEPTPPAPVKPVKPKPVKTQPVKQVAVVKPEPLRPSVKPKPQPDPDPPIPHPSPVMSEAQLAGAETAGSGAGAGSGSGAGEGAGSALGAGGGGCDMTGRLQQALSRDPLVRTAVAEYAGKAVKVWDGDWVWFHSDVGQGLSAVRQAIEWEIAYAPAACRSKPMHGLVVFSVRGAQGPIRLAVGSGNWRWSDLVTVR